MADEKKTVWKDVAGYEGIYEVSNTGEIRSFDKWVDIGLGRKQFKIARILRPGKGSHGYLTIAFCKDKIQKSVCIHRIVIETFIPNPLKYRCVNHKDGNKLNNNVENLEWCSHSMNNKHAYDTGLKIPYRVNNLNHAYNG